MRSVEMRAVTAVILAGGKGLRVAHLLPGIPKPMACVAGRPFLDWVILQLSLNGIGSFVVSVGHLGEVIESHIARNPVGGAVVKCVREDVPCGTAGGFLNAVRSSSEVPPGGYLVVNGDSMILADAGLLLDEARRQGWDAALFGMQVDDAQRYGVLSVDETGLLRGFSEKGKASGVINTGLYWFSPDCLSRFPDRLLLSFEHDVFPRLIDGGARVGVVTIEAPFIDIGTPSSLKEAGEFIDAYFLKQPRMRTEL